MQIEYSMELHQKFNYDSECWNERCLKNDTYKKENTNEKEKNK